MSSKYIDSTQQIWSALSAMQQNVYFMLQESSNVYLPDTLESRMASMLGEFDSLLHDLRDEAKNLEDKLGMHVGEAPNDPGIVNKDPLVTVGFLREWPEETFQIMDDLVKALDVATRNDPRAGTAFILVAESATNMLSAFHDMQVALDQIEVAVGKGDQADGL
jgi:hypothetical protein